MFHPFVRGVAARRRPLLVGAEAAGSGLDTGQARAPRSRSATPGVMHGFYSYLLQDDAGNPLEAYSISAGLDYPGVGPEHAYLKDEGLVRYAAGDRRRGARRLRAALPDRGHHPGDRVARTRWRILPRLAEELGPDARVVVNVSGRGDKDIDIVREAGLGG